MNSWNQQTIRDVYDSVLVGSVLELREALELLESNNMPSDGHYVYQIREGLRLMERELDRRGLQVTERNGPTQTSRL